MDFRSIISGIETDLRQYEQALDAYRHSPVSRGPARARVLLTGVPVVRGAERVVELIEAAGAIVVAMENCTGLKPVLEDVDADAPDPMVAIAKKYYHLPCSVLTPNLRRFASLEALVRKYAVECVIDLVWQACLTYDVESAQARRLCEQKLGLPYLKIGTDYSPGDSARISSRVEALVETVRSRGRAVGSAVAVGCPP
jgi:benzoyl-CoA reductase/2-hydroxyglutaryl-CoA dehydratase subunit BcrC/BadD/HgdB